MSWRPVSRPPHPPVRYPEDWQGWPKSKRLLSQIAEASNRTRASGGRCGRSVCDKGQDNLLETKLYHVLLEAVGSERLRDGQHEEVFTIDIQACLYVLIGRFNSSGTSVATW